MTKHKTTGAASRSLRVSSQIQREVASMMRSEVNDSRASLASITEVDLSRDFSWAKIYITYLGDIAERAEVLHILNEAAPNLRHLLGKSMRIHTIPKLTFLYDDVVEYGAQMSKMIDEAVAADQQRHTSDTGEQS